MSDPHLYGVLAEFATAEQLLAAVARARTETRHAVLEAYSPVPVEGLVEALGPRKADRIPFWMLLGAIAGGAGTFALEWYAAVWDYPINVGGRPLYALSAFMVVCFELTILFAALTPAIGMLALNGLPRLHHPVFDAPRFHRASRDRFFLCILATDEKFERSSGTAFLRETGALSVAVVES